MKDSYQVLRLIFVWGSFAPLFVLWAIRGINPSVGIPANWFLGAMAILALLPNLLLMIRWRLAESKKISATAVVVSATDNREHLIVYLIALMLPLYDANLSSAREVVAVLAAFLIIMLMFWRSNLHYLNLFFALFGYRVFTLRCQSNNGGSDKLIVLLTKRDSIHEGVRVEGYMLSDSFWVDTGESFNAT